MPTRIPCAAALATMSILTLSSSCLNKNPRDLPPSSTINGFSLPCFGEPDIPKYLKERRDYRGPRVKIAADSYRNLNKVDVSRRATDDERSVLESWVWNDFPAIDYYSRTGTNPSTTHRNRSVTVDDVIKKLNNFVQEFGKGEGTVYRGEEGYSEANILEFVNHLKNQSTITLGPKDRKVAIPISTSTNVGTALRFACMSARDPSLRSKTQHQFGIIFRFKTTSGYQLPGDFFSRESEVLIPANTSFKVKKISVFDLSNHDVLLQQKPTVRWSDVCNALLLDLEVAG
jgi:hypothetical protein